MIEWKQVDKDNPPKGSLSYLFIYDETIFEGWTIDELDDKDFPMWEASEGPTSCYDVRWYAEINWPKGDSDA